MSDLYEHEESFHQKDNKQWRKQRKYLQTSDRSKHKKTDQVERETAVDTTLPRGRVIAIGGEGILVETNGQRILCTLRGSLKQEKTLQKNLIIVGDYVRLNDQTIAQIEPRYSTLSRTEIRGVKEQLIAANIDQAIILLSVVEPQLKPAIVDRYLIAIARHHIQPIIAINKVDLLGDDPKEEMRYREFLEAYEPLGIPILSISAKTHTGIDALKSLMKDKTSVITGQSGVGKSSILNTTFQMDRKIGGLADKTAKGSHTTTTAELINLPNGGYCIDTPGIRSFGVFGLTKEEVFAHFTDLSKIGKKCHYADCTHTVEPSCAVLKALEKGKLHPIRYESFRSLYLEATGGIDNRTKRKLED
jgi:ribosome biogenesis GTPase